MYSDINIKRVIFILYCVVPFIFYGIPLIVSINDGYLRMYFFNIYDIPSIFFFISLIGHAAFGFLIYRSIASTKYVVKNSVTKNSSYKNLFILLFYIVYLFVPLGYFGMITNVIFLLLISRFRPNNIIFLVLTLITFVKLVIGYDRYHFVVIILLWMLPRFSRMKITEMLALSFLGLFIMIYILQPVKAGHMPFSDSIYTLGYSIRHLFPIYIGGYLSYDSDFQLVQLLSESMPLFKTLTGSASSIEIIAKKGLPQEVFNSGTRLGSNSAVFFANFYGILVLSFILISIKFILKKFNDVYIHNVILLLLILEGPMFIRHSFGQAFINIIIGVVTAILFSLFVNIIQIHKRNRNRFSSVG